MAKQFTNQEDGVKRITTLCSNRLGLVPSAVTFTASSTDICAVLEDYIQSKGVDVYKDYDSQVLGLVFPNKFKNLQKYPLDEALKFGLVIPKKKNKKTLNNDGLYQLIGDAVRHMDHGAELQLMCDSKLESAISGLIRSGRKSSINVRNLGEVVGNTSFNKKLFIEFDLNTVLGLLFDINENGVGGDEIKLNVVNARLKEKKLWKFDLTIGKYITQRKYKKLKGNPLGRII